MLYEHVKEKHLDLLKWDERLDTKSNLVLADQRDKVMDMEYLNIYVKYLRQFRVLIWTSLIGLDVHPVKGLGKGGRRRNSLRVSLV